MGKNGVSMGKNGVEEYDILQLLFIKLNFWLCN